MLNSALRWASLMYVSASIAEMLISGLELVLSVIAGRIFRKRIISNERWFGVGLVTLGITLVGLIDYFNAEEDTSDPKGSKSDVIIGIVLIICQSILSVLQDISEEIFMQVKGSEFPATLMLGMEGFLGFVFGIILYFTCGDSLGEDPNETLHLLRTDRTHLAWIFGLPFLFLITGVFNIRATEVTSSMTRNIWKNLRTVLVWIFALLIFYIGGDDYIGEAWVVPESLYVLMSFAVMTIGILMYYINKKRDDELRTSNHTNAKIAANSS